MAVGDTILSREDVLRAVREKIAVQVVESLDEETKTAVIAEAVAEIVGGWEFKRILEEQIKAAAATELAVHLERPEVKENLKQQAVAAATAFVENFGTAMLTMLYKAAGVVKASGYGGGSHYETDIGTAIKRQLGIGGS